MVAAPAKEGARYSATVKCQAQRWRGYLSIRRAALTEPNTRLVRPGETRRVRRRSGYVCLKRVISPADPFTWSLSATASSSLVRPGCSAFGSRSVAINVQV